MYISSPRRQNYGPCMEIISEMHRLAGKTPFGIVLIPDEFQVEDELWRTVTSRSEEQLERDRPQRVFHVALRSRGIPKDLTIYFQYWK